MRPNQFNMLALVMIDDGEAPFANFSFDVEQPSTWEKQAAVAVTGAITNCELYGEISVPVRILINPPLVQPNLQWLTAVAAFGEGHYEHGRLKWGRLLTGRRGVVSGQSCCEWKPKEADVSQRHSGPFWQCQSHRTDDHFTAHYVARALQGSCLQTDH